MRDTQSINIHISSDVHTKLKLAAVNAGIPMTQIASPAIEREVSLLALRQKLLTYTIGITGTPREGYQLVLMEHSAAEAAPRRIVELSEKGLSVDALSQAFVELSAKLHAVTGGTNGGGNNG